MNTPIGRAARLQRFSANLWTRAIRAIYAELCKELNAKKSVCKNCDNLSTENHHMRGRASTLLIDKRFIVRLCDKCHKWVHAYPKAARAVGLFCEQGKWNDPPKDDVTISLRDLVLDRSCMIRDRLRGMVSKGKTRTVKKKVGIITGIIFALFYNATAGVVTLEFQSAVIQRESGWNPKAIGRHNERGLFQIKPSALKDLRKEYAWTVADWQLMLPEINKACGQGYLVLTERRLRNKLGRPPTEWEVYQGFKLGVTGFMRRRNA